MESKYENPIDNFFINISRIISPIFKKANFTPNAITGLSFIFNMISLYLFNKNKYLPAGIICFIAYFFDVMDGYYARRYSMTSKFGDSFDHINDMTFYGLFLYLSFIKDTETRNKFKKIFIILLILHIFNLVYTGCQEKLYDDNNGKSLSLNYSKVLCPDPNMNRYLRYVGTGTKRLIVGLIIIFYKKI